MSKSKKNYSYDWSFMFNILNNILFNRSLSLKSVVVFESQMYMKVNHAYLNNKIFFKWNF
jgi:hypothetical protein